MSMRKTTTPQEDRTMLTMYLSSETPIQREIARMFKIAQGTVSKHIMDAALKYMEEFGLSFVDSTYVREMKILFLGGDPDFGNLVFKYARARHCGQLSSADSRSLRGTVNTAA